MKWKLFALAPLLTLTLAAAPTRVTPINPAEAVFAPFWDYNMQEMRNWKVVRGATAHPFGSTGFSWSRKNSETGKSAFLMERANPVPCARYDKLISCIRAPGRKHTENHPGYGRRDKRTLLDRQKPLPG